VRLLNFTNKIQIFNNLNYVSIKYAVVECELRKYQMPLNADITIKSLEALKSRYESLSPEDTNCLKELNDLSAQRMLPLSQQSDQILSLIDLQLKDLLILVQSIFARMIEIWDGETHLNKQQHLKQGNFDPKVIHKRGLHDQLQDHDMTRLMPKSCGKIDVLAPINRFDKSTHAVCEGIKIALANEHVKYIIIPIGPGHWRGLYLTKPDDKSAQYQLEPLGPDGANFIRDFALGLLSECGVKI